MGNTTTPRMETTSMSTEPRPRKPLSAEATAAAPLRRTTRQRVAITELLGRASGFMSAQQLHAELKDEGTAAGLATVYRTLQAMSEAGEVDSIRDDSGEMVYRKCATEGHHHHLVCRSCGRTVELEAKQVERWANQVAAENGFRSVGHDLELFGLCQDC